METAVTMTLQDAWSDFFTWITSKGPDGQKPFKGERHKVRCVYIAECQRRVGRLGDKRMESLMSEFRPDHYKVVTIVEVQ